MTQVLGYDQYAAAGGDWGAFVTSELSLRHPDNIIAVYLTLPVVPGIHSRSLRESDFADDEIWMYRQMKAVERHTKSHFTAHFHDPQTLAYALNDSPAGLAAWLWERRRSWSDCNGNPLNAFDRDFLCTTASIYWFTETIGTSMRLYAELRSIGAMRGHDDRSTNVATGYGIAPKELLFAPRRLAEERTDLRRWSVLPRGGHFLPAEQPALVVDELRAYFDDFRR